MGSSTATEERQPEQGDSSELDDTAESYSIWLRTATAHTP